VVVRMITSSRTESGKCGSHGKLLSACRFFGQMPFLTPVIRYDDNIRMLLKESVCGQK